ncbi:hypothetical protein ACYPKM_02550 [Pseudomonas aeruginosa]
MPKLITATTAVATLGVDAMLPADDCMTSIRSLAGMVNASRPAAARLASLKDAICELIGGSACKPSFEVKSITAGLEQTYPAVGEACLFVDQDNGFTMHLGKRDGDFVMLNRYGSNRIRSVELQDMSAWVSVPACEALDTPWLAITEMQRPARGKECLVLDAEGKAHIGKLMGVNFFFTTYGTDACEFQSISSFTHFMPFDQLYTAVQQLAQIEA